MERLSKGRVGLYSTTRQNNACQKVLYHRMSATICRPEQAATWLPHISRGSLATKKDRSALRQITLPPSGKPPEAALACTV
jgi:hypothetical protein